MLKKLKHKFILINMLLVSIVLVITFIIVGVSTYQGLTNDSFMALEESLSKPIDDAMQKKHIIPPKDSPKPQKKPMLNNVVLMVTLGPDNLPRVSEGTIEIDDDVLLELINTCISNNTTTGIISDQNFRYMMQNRNGITEIAFYDLSIEHDIMYNLIITFIIVGFASLAAFYLISLYLAKWALSPVERSWKQQQQFIADASHELKTPLTVILANTDVLATHKNDTIKSQSKWIEYIKTEATRMMVLVNNLLFLAKSDAAKESLSRSSFNFSDMVLGCVLPFESIAYEQKKDLQLNIAPNLSLVGDEIKLKQLIAILLDNAFKYSGENGVIKIAVKQKQDQRIQLSVTNTGEPIASEHLPYLFERFYRADEARARDCGGYGLGLSIAQNIVNMHNGKIHITSTKEEGTTFAVLLPNNI